MTLDNSPASVCPLLRRGFQPSPKIAPIADGCRSPLIFGEVRTWVQLVAEIRSPLSGGKLICFAARTLNLVRSQRCNFRSKI
ncbi:MAG: hypothetical protein MUE44_24510 [Oscillatoriaceae cyanobacterium Prado104]|nr:hypothetical protein [Oscillatoriaceae cyanobacterium Prado104]